MSRPLPTDPPGDPVNRVHEFLASKSSDTLLAALLPTDPPDEHRALVPPALLKKIAWPLVEDPLLELCQLYEENPWDRTVVLRIAKYFARRGELLRAKTFLSWFRELMPKKPPITVDEMLILILAPKE